MTDVLNRLFIDDAHTDSGLNESECSGEADRASPDLFPAVSSHIRQKMPGGDSEGQGETHN